MAGRSFGYADLPEVVGLPDEEDSLIEPTFSQAGDSSIVMPTPMHSRVGHVAPATWSTIVTAEVPATVTVKVPQECQDLNFSPVQMVAAVQSRGLDVSSYLNPTLWKELAAKEFSALQETEGFSQDWGNLAKTRVDETPWIVEEASSTAADQSPAHDCDRDPSTSAELSLEDLLMRRQQPFEKTKSAARNRSKTHLTSRTRGQKGNAALKPGEKVIHSVMEEKGTEKNVLPREISPGQPSH